MRDAMCYASALFWGAIAAIAGVPLLLAIVLGALCGCGAWVVLNVCAAAGSVDDED